MIKKLLTSAAALAMAAGGVSVAVAAPANATDTSATVAACPATKLCGYLSKNYVGDPGEVAGHNSNLLQYNKFNNALSVSNSGTQCTVRIYSKTGYGGSHVDIRRGYGIGDLTGTAYYKNVASNRWCP
ncbi:peptidase inhibitor family I36 protein [Streptomyces iconiensis]|uniref:Peptidase inhibitor family I36 protein n=1 Tax=Streptomyces iconiensis TaxID=1384038 RepID=A0ABT7A143_9ACTN|nr:peptidase inhibitor family I36 protein [Streptomyces iconiensis]MDJ1135049.1 peptidase inhibitor family I36 protein [Streptomyces iconiensis]